MLVFLATLYTYGQQPLDLKIEEGADAPNTESVRFYFLSITNISDDTEGFKISAKDISCTNIPPEQQVTLNKTILDSTQTTELTNITLGSNETLEFYLKISRPDNTPVDKWNCIEVQAINDNSIILSNAILIKSLIPDPSKFN